MAQIGVGSSGAGAAGGVQDALLQILTQRRADALLAEQQQQTELERQVQLQNQQRMSQDLNLRTAQERDKAAAAAKTETDLNANIDALGLDPKTTSALKLSHKDPSMVGALTSAGILAPKPTSTPGSAEEQYLKNGEAITRAKYQIPDGQPLPPEYQREALRVGQRNYQTDKTPPDAAGGPPLTPDTIERFTHFDPVHGDDPKQGTLGLTPNGILQDSIRNALTGEVPLSLRGLTSKGAIDSRRLLIDNVVGSLATKAGTDVATLRSSYRALDGAQRTMASRAATTNQAAEQASTYLGLALDQSGKVGRTGSPLVNKYLQYAQRDIVGDPSLSLFEQYIYAAAREYAKVASGSSGSVAGLTDTAAGKVDQMLKASQNPQAFQAVVHGMLKDMSGAQQAQIDTLYGVNTTIGNFFSAVTGVAPSGHQGRAGGVGIPTLGGITPTAAPGGPSAATGGMRFDSQGRLMGGP